MVSLVLMPKIHEAAASCLYSLKFGMHSDWETPLILQIKDFLRELGYVVELSFANRTIAIHW